MKPCPDKTCTAGGNRLANLSPLQEAKIAEPWTGSAQRCTYCGVVFTGQGASADIKGYYDDPMGKQGWSPLKNA